jgi:hypothetical protein
MNTARCALFEPQFCDLPPISGIEDATDMSVHDALLFAWRNCSILNQEMQVGTIDVQLFICCSAAYVCHSIAGHRHGRARLFLRRFAMWPRSLCTR